MADQSRGSLRDAIIGRRLKSIGYALYALAVCVWAYDGWYGPFSSGEGGFYFFVAFGALIFLGGFLVFKGQQYLARSESDLDRLVNSGPPAVVLLRPFESDATVLGTGKWFWEYTRTPFTGKYFIEQDLAEAVRPFGPLVAIGQPGEALPLPGAARFREADQTWKDRVVDLVRRQGP